MSFPGDGKKSTDGKVLCQTGSVREDAERIKKQLSNQSSVTFECVPVNGQYSQQVMFVVTRKEFEEGCASLFEKGLKPVKRLLEVLFNCLALFVFIIFSSSYCLILSNLLFNSRS